MWELPLNTKNKKPNLDCLKIGTVSSSVLFLKHKVFMNLEFLTCYINLCTNVGSELKKKLIAFKDSRNSSKIAPKLS